MQPLVGRHALRDRRDQLFGLDLAARHDHGHGHLAAPGVRPPYDGGVGHGRVAHEQLLELGRRDRMDDLREAFRIALARVRRDGRLAPGWSVDAAADWAWMRSHVSGWQQLVDERGRRPQRYVERTISSILGELVVPAR